MKSTETVASLEAITFLDEMADRLDRWADETIAGSWSTHQVSANREASSDCRRVAAKLRRSIS